MHTQSCAASSGVQRGSRRRPSWRRRVCGRTQPTAGPGSPAHCMDCAVEPPAQPAWLQRGTPRQRVAANRASKDCPRLLAVQIVSGKLPWRGFTFTRGRRKRSGRKRSVRRASNHASALGADSGARRSATVGEAFGGGPRRYRGALPRPPLATTSVQLWATRPSTTTRVPTTTTSAATTTYDDAYM